MNAIALNVNNSNIVNYPTSYREKNINGKLYRITSVYKGEKELGTTLENLAIRHVLDEMDGRAKELLRT